MARAIYIQSIERALDIVDLCAASEDGLSVTRIAETMGLKRTTVQNLVATLVHRKALERRGDPSRYALGPSLLNLAYRAEQRRLYDTALEVMRDARRRLPDAHFVLGGYAGGEVVRLLFMDPNRPGVIQRKHNDHVHPYSSALSVVFHAFGGARDCEAYRQSYPFSDYGAHFWENERAFEHYLQKVRDEGVAAPWIRGRFTRAAAPVFGRGSQLAAVFGGFISSERPESDVNVLLALVQRGAERLSHSSKEGLGSDSDPEPKPSELP